MIYYTDTHRQEITGDIKVTEQKSNEFKYVENLKLLILLTNEKQN